VLAPFLFIIVIDYIAKRATKNFGYLTHKGSESTRTTRSTTSNRLIGDLNFADDIALLEGQEAALKRHRE
jgi:hypothetical protein